MMIRRGGVALATLIATSQGVGGDVTLVGQTCGQKKCQLDEYCSGVTSQCHPCHEVCDNSKFNHNFEEDICVQQCQNYLHDIRYMRAGTQNEARTALIISSILLALVLLLCLQKIFYFIRNNRNKFSWDYLKKNKMFKKNRVVHYPNGTMHNPGELPKVPKNEVKLDIRAGKPMAPKKPILHQPLNVQDLDDSSKSTGINNTNTTVSTRLSNRQPAEDATLDYSYDNMGLNVTPPPTQGTSHF